MTIPLITANPSRTQPQDTFDVNVETFIPELTAVIPAMNADIATVNANKLSVDENTATCVIKAAEAAASAQSANGAAGAAKWVSGTTYTEGACTWSPLNYLSYRRKTAGGGTTDPSADTTNWAQIQFDYHNETNAAPLAQGVHLTAATSGSTGLTIADDLDIDFGAGNFTLSFKGALDSWSISAQQWLITKFSGSTLGYALYISTANKVTVAIWRNVADATSNYAMTNVTGFIAGTVHEVEAVVTRETATADGSISFYFDGVLVETVTIPFATTTNAGNTIDNTGTIYVLGTSTTRAAGTAQQVLTFNRALTAAQVLDLYRNGVAFADMSGSQVARYASDFSATTDGWANFTNTTVAGAIDPLGGADTTWLRSTITASGVAAIRRLATITAYKKYRISFSYYIPVSATINAFALKGATGVATYLTINSPTKGTATNVAEFEITESENLTGFSLYAVGGTTADTFYIKSFVITQIGATLQLEPEGIKPNQWLDSSSNELHASYPSAGASLTRKQSDGTYIWTTAITGDTTLTSIVPAGYELEKIVFKNSTTNAVSVRLGTTAGGVDVFGLTALSISTTLGGFKTIRCDQAFSGTAAQTLYLSSTVWGGASLTATLYFKEVV